MANKIKVVVVNPEELEKASEIWTKALYDCYIKHQSKKEITNETQLKAQAQ